MSAKKLTRRQARAWLAPIRACFAQIKSGQVDAGPVVRNTKETWQKILANVIAEPKYQPWPEYRGATRKKRSNVELNGVPLAARPSEAV